jgi:hypothetical protein
MPQNQQHIHCIISNCHYWENGNQCMANEILVASDAFGSQQSDRVDAHSAKQLQPTSSQDCMSTCCKTFVEKGSGKINVDGVQRLT